MKYQLVSLMFFYCTIGIINIMHSYNKYKNKVVLFVGFCNRFKYGKFKVITVVI